MADGPRCPHCLDDGHVCENHPAYPWGVTVEGHSGDCGGAGMPCPACCSPIPEDGTHSIAEAFTPDWMRPGLTDRAMRPPARAVTGADFFSHAARRTWSLRASEDLGRPCGQRTACAGLPQIEDYSGVGR